MKTPVMHRNDGTAWMKGTVFARCGIRVLKTHSTKRAGDVTCKNCQRAKPPPRPPAPDYGAFTVRWPQPPATRADGRRQGGCIG